MFSGLYSAVASSLMMAQDTALTSALPGNSTRLIYKTRASWIWARLCDVRFPTGLRVFLLQVSRLILGPTQPAILWVPEVRIPGLKQQGSKADHSPHLVLNIRICGSLRLLTLCLYGVYRNNFYNWFLVVLWRGIACVAFIVEWKYVRTIAFRMKKL